LYANGGGQNEGIYMKNYFRKYFVALLLTVVACGGNLSRPEAATMSESSDESDASDTSEISDSSESSDSSEESDHSDPSESSDLSSIRPTILLINELYYDDTTSDSDGHVFIELYGDASANISGYQLLFVNGADGSKTDSITFADATIPEDGLLVVADAKTGSSDSTNVSNADVIENFDPQNGPDSVILLTPEGLVIDVLGYGEGMLDADENGHEMYESRSASSVEAGLSLSRMDATDTNDNSADFLSTEPTPGELNPIVAESPDESPDVSDSLESSGESELLDVSEASGTSEPTDPSEPSSDAIESGIFISEVVVDPQQDWNGNGTIGTTDEWLEIVNQTSETIDVTTYSLSMIDGTDETLILGDADVSSLSFSEGGSLDLFQSGEYLVISNPAGDMKNSITIELYDDSNLLIDEVMVDDGNATGIEDESWQEIGEDVWGLGTASPGS